MKNRASTWAALALSTLLVACSAEKPENLLTSAKSYLDKGDARAAVIQIKNALQENPELPEGRYLLGAALLASGAASQAEVELRKALALGYDRESVVPKLATALMAQGMGRQLVDEFGSVELTAKGAQAEFKLALSEAQQSLGNAPQAAAALSAALSADPDHVPARMVDARRTAARGDLDAALAKIDAVLKNAEKSPEAWTLKGDLFLLGFRKPEEALAAYRKALEVRPGHLMAHLRVGTIEMERGRVAEAKAAVDSASKLAPNHPETRYLQTRVAILDKDFKRARESSQQLLKMAPDNALALQVAGLIELQSDSLVQAENLLRRSLQIAPSLTVTRKALIRVHLLSRNPTAAIEVLNAAADKNGLPPALYGTAGELYLQLGQAAKAEEFFQKALKLDPRDSQRRVAVAIAQIAGGGVATGMEGLSDIAAAGSSTTADLALISLHMRRKEFDAALAAVDRLEAKDPGKPLSHYLRGRSLFLKGDQARARESFEAALKIDPNHFASITSLAAIDLREQRPEDANKRLKQASERDPKNARASMALAEIAMRRGAPASEVAAMIGQAIEANPNDPASRIVLIQHHLRTGNSKEAVTAGTRALSAFPDHPDLLFWLGRAHLAARDVQQAIGSFGKLANLQPRSARPLLGIADAHLFDGKPELAAQNLRKALELDPTSIQARRGLVAAEVSAKRFPEAVAMARQIQKQHPKQPAGYVLEGDVFIAQRDLANAEKAYRLGVKQSPAPEVAAKLYAVLAGSKPADAVKFAEQWQRDHPKDSSLLLQMADTALGRKDYAAAERHYVAVTKLTPNNAVALNNLAWVSGTLDRPEAISIAERALTLAPNEPAFLDTLAMLHSRAGAHAKAIDVQSRALAVRDDPGLRLNLAKILIKAGEQAKAKAELERLQALGDKFPGQREVTALLESVPK